MKGLEQEVMTPAELLEVCQESVGGMGFRRKARAATQVHAGETWQASHLPACAAVGLEPQGGTHDATEGLSPGEREKGQAENRNGEVTGQGRAGCSGSVLCTVLGRPHTGKCQEAAPGAGPTGQRPL